MVKLIDAAKRVPLLFVLAAYCRRQFNIHYRVRHLRRLGYSVEGKLMEVHPSDLKIDIVIPSVEKDFEILPYTIDFARENVKHPISNVYIVSPDSKTIKTLCKLKSCIFVDESTVLSFKKSDIEYTASGVNRSGWMYQQFLKWCGDSFCTEQNYLVVDSDTIFISPQVFERKGRTVLNFSDEFNQPYFDAYRRLLGRPIDCPVSFTSHHILINVPRLKQLKCLLMREHGIEWSDAIMKAIDKTQVSGHSDYDTYGHFVLQNYPRDYILEYWHNLGLTRAVAHDIPHLASKYRLKFKSLSFHSWNQG